MSLSTIDFTGFSSWFFFPQCFCHMHRHSIAAAAGWQHLIARQTFPFSAAYPMHRFKLNPFVQSRSPLILRTFWKSPSPSLSSIWPTPMLSWRFKQCFARGISPTCRRQLVCRACTVPRHCCHRSMCQVQTQLRLIQVTLLHHCEGWHPNFVFQCVCLAVALSCIYVPFDHCAVFLGCLLCSRTFLLSCTSNIIWS